MVAGLWQPSEGGDRPKYNTNFDDDEVSSIPPGSTILYLVYATQNAGDGLSNAGVSNCLSSNDHKAIFDAATACVYEEAYQAASAHCEYEWWSQSLHDLVPDYYAFSSTASDTSGDGATNFATRFGASWDQFIKHPCVADSTVEGQVGCDAANAGGNVIFDGGSDMYDIGNLLMTSEMDQNPYNQNPYGGGATPADGCDLGAITYESNFVPIETTCFGPGGFYEMSEMEGVWMFFSKNFFTDKPVCTSIHM
jgi:hypothetical protein